MAVLVECISVIVRRDSIFERYPGGWEKFLSNLPPAPFCFDDEIACVSFMTPTDVQAFCEELGLRGLVFLEDGNAVDIVVVDQLQGKTTPCEWLEYTHIDYQGKGEISAAWFFEGPRLIDGLYMKNAGLPLSVPEGWDYETSRSKKPGFLKDDEVFDRLEYLSTEGKIDCFLDTGKGETVLIDHSIERPDLYPFDVKKLLKILNEAEELGDKLEWTRLYNFRRGIYGIYCQLADRLLPQAQSIAAYYGDRHPFPHFTVGCILEFMNKYPEAEESLRRAYRINPDSFHSNRELTRCLGRQNKPQEALAFAQRAVELRSFDTDSLRNLAICHALCGHREEALKVVNQALQINPNDLDNINLKTYLEDETE